MLPDIIEDSLIAIIIICTFFFAELAIMTITNYNHVLYTQ